MVLVYYWGGDGIYSNGIDTYEVAILYNDELCYDSGLCDDIFAHQTEGEITKLMEKIQLLPNKNTEKVVTLTLEDITLLQKSVSDKVEELKTISKNNIFFKEINKEIAKYSNILERLK